MSDPPHAPRITPPPPEGSRFLGIILGVVFLAGAAALMFLTSSQALQIAGGVLLVAFFVTGMVLTSNPRTARVGTGLMISLGVALVVGAGVCFAVVAGVGRTPYYETCHSMRVVGAAPIPSGQPGYRTDLDRNGDGLACGDGE